MRILHTSDWHLGQNFCGKTRKAEHQAFFDWLLQQIEAHSVDAILVAGDIFDTSTPPSYARELYHNVIVAISRLNCQLLILGGNHDSVATLNETRDILACLNTRVIAGVTADPAAQLVTLKNRAGEPGAIVCAIPYIRPRDVLRSQAGESIQDKQQALSNAIQQHYQQLYTLAVAEQSKHAKPTPIIATGHLTAIGATVTDSVRDIYVGTLEALPAQAFPPADYIALGHIHRPQKVAKSEHIRYSGSPIALSFDELNTQKQVLLVDFTDGKLQKVTPLAVPGFQAMRVIKGDLAGIEAQLPDLHKLGMGRSEAIWLSIEVDTEDYLTDLQQRIQSLCEDLPVEILQLRRARKNRQAAISQLKQETLHELSVEDIFERRLALETFSGQEAEQRKLRINQLYQAIVSEVEEQNGQEAEA